MPVCEDIFMYIVSVFKICEGLCNFFFGKEGCDEAYFSVIICRKVTHFTRQEGCDGFGIPHM